MNRDEALDVLRKWTGDPDTGEVADALKVLAAPAERAGKTEAQARETR